MAAAIRLYLDENLSPRIADQLRRRGVDVVTVVASPTSSNSNRLREVARKLGVDAHMVDGADEIQPEWLHGKSRIGLTAGASAPDVLVRQVIERLRALGAMSVRTLDGIEETVKFPLPKGLKLDGAAEDRLAHLR